MGHVNHYQGFVRPFNLCLGFGRSTLRQINGITDRKLMWLNTQKTTKKGNKKRRCIYFSDFDWIKGLSVPEIFCGPTLFKNKGETI